MDTIQSEMRILNRQSVLVLCVWFVNLIVQNEENIIFKRLKFLYYIF